MNSLQEMYSQCCKNFWPFLTFIAKAMNVYNRKLKCNLIDDIKHQIKMTKRTRK